MDIKIGYQVRFLNDVGGGRVSRIEGKLVYVEDTDGFERPVPANQLIVVGDGKTPPATYERAIPIKSKLVEPDVPAPAPEKPKPDPVFPVVETPEGERLNIVLAYEPREIKHLNTTTFFPVLVNDSNYYLYFSYMTRGDDAEWTTRYHGLIEPGVQLQLDEFGHADLNDMTHIAVQYVAFKQDRHFKLKNPALVEQRLDVTRFHKLHTFHSSDYFDTPVLTVDITIGDRPVRQIHIDSSELEAAMRQKGDRPAPANKPKGKPQQQRSQEIVVQDLHIAELIDNLAGMTNADILNYQLDKFNEVMRAHLKHPGQRIVFIHGKGEGVLRRALLEELKRHYPACEVQDASFKEYGFGATQVTIHHKH